jgi:3-oxoacyl-[acyl-carrier protein] reductase
LTTEFAGQVAVVTGASRGIGRAIALKLAALGARTVVNYRANDSEAAKVVESICQSGGEAIALKADVSNADAVKEMFRQITQKWGQVDILVNNAGVTRDALLPRLSDEAWDTVIDINLRGSFLCTRMALRSMMTQTRGRIINIASVAGLTGNPGQTNYSASKGGLIAFTRAAAREVGARNITVNAIAPGFIVTDMTDQLSPEARSAILSHIPLKRYGQPQEVAELVAFLASEKSGYITAQVISIDGGVL